MVGGKAGFHKDKTAATRGKVGSNNGKSSRPRSAGTSPLCPECGSAKVWKDGLRYTRHGDVQRWLCRDCGFRFSESSLHSHVKVHVNGQNIKMSNPKTNHLQRRVLEADLPLEEVPDSLALRFRENMGSHKVTSVGKGLNNFRPYNRNCRVSVSEREAKNLVAAEIGKEKQAAGAKTKTELEAEAKGKIIEFAWHLKKNGRTEMTIKNMTNTLRSLMKDGANLADPETVKEVIANRPILESSKHTIVNTYKSFAKFMKIAWEPPKYNCRSKLPFIPLEREIDDLIAHCGKKTSTVLQLLKETGMRIGEALRTEWIDVDAERRTVRVDPEKGSNPRILKMSDKLLGMINRLPRVNSRIFGTSTQNSFQVCFNISRKRAAQKLQNPRLLQVHFHTLRHWKGTMEYHKTKDPWHVKHILGLKSLKNIETYINLDQVLFESPVEEFHVKVAEKPEEIKALLEVGFEYICQKDGLAFLRKRK